MGTVARRVKKTASYDACFKTCELAMKMIVAKGMRTKNLANKQFSQTHKRTLLTKGQRWPPNIIANKLPTFCVLYQYFLLKSKVRNNLCYAPPRHITRNLCNLFEKNLTPTRLKLCKTKKQKLCKTKKKSDVSRIKPTNPSSHQAPIC